MNNRPLPLLAAAGLAAMLALGGCAGASTDAPVNPAPVAAPVNPAPVAAPATAAQVPCTERLRPGGAGDTPMALTPEARAEIERLRGLTPEQQAAEAEASRARDPELAARLDRASDQVTRAARPCADR